MLDGVGNQGVKAVRSRAFYVVLIAIALCRGDASTMASTKAPVPHDAPRRQPSENLEAPSISSISPVPALVHAARTRRALLSHNFDDCVCTTHTHTTSAAATTTTAQVQTSSTTAPAQTTTTTAAESGSTSTPVPTTTLAPETSTSSPSATTGLVSAASSSDGHTTTTDTTPAPTTAHGTSPTPTTTPSPMCPANSESLSGSPSNMPNDCICLQGYTGSAGASGSCTPCPAGNVPRMPHRRVRCPL